MAANVCEDCKAKEASTPEAPKAPEGTDTPQQ